MPGSRDIETSHLQLLNKNNVQLDSVNINNVKNIIECISNKRAQDLGNGYSDNYKLSLYRTLRKRLKLQLTASKALKLKTPKRITKKPNNDFIVGIKNLYVYFFSFNVNSSILNRTNTTRSLLNCAIAVILVLCTNIKLTFISSLEIQTLRQMMLDDGTTPFEVKFTSNELFFLQRYENNYKRCFKRMFELIEKRNSIFDDLPTSRLDKVVNSSSAVINSKLRRVYLVVNKIEPPSSFGISKMKKSIPQNILWDEIENSLATSFGVYHTPQINVKDESDNIEPDVQENVAGDQF